MSDYPTHASRRRWKLPAAAVAVVALAGAGTAVFRAETHAPARITVSDSACAPQWDATTSGRHVYQVTDTGDSPEEVTIVGPNHLTAYAELEMVAPGTTETLVAILPPGRYTWNCEADDGSDSYSDLRAATGPQVTGATPWIPVTASQLAGAVSLYRTSVTRGLLVLEADTGRLRAAVAAGHLSQAKQLWLVAHLAYARLGAAYDTFGPYADEIDGRADGLPGGVHDPKFTGFLRLEYGLWHHQSRAELTAVADTLNQDVRGLVGAFPNQATDPNDIALRTHEILENSLQFELTGDTDEGSNTNVATFAANVQGTQMTLAALMPLLKLTDPSLLKQASSGLDRLAALAATYHHPNGSWTALQSLSTAQRETLDGTVGGVLEQLSLLPDHLDLLLTQDNNPS
jgi:iron uptake system EfeUOB component EfeO/EfeM